MSRLIDSLPTPAHVREKLVIVTSRSRSGTFSLYQALQILGYKPYHMYEVVQTNTHMAIFEEALRCKYFGAGKPYGRAEFDKWFADYDTLIEIPAFFAEDIIAAYPDAKYIHVDRDVDKWLVSVLNIWHTVRPLLNSTAMKFMALYDPFIKLFISLHVTILRCLDHGMHNEDPNMAIVLKEDYLQLTDQVKKLVPRENLACFSLEDEFGWEQICPWLGKPIPATKYPRGNAPKEFQQLTMRLLGPSFAKAAGLVIGAVSIPVGAGLWYWLRLK
ncbi:hypothetical protein M406DRAFT_295808 [Cryphonectria parasitica EP155]|uniref:Uncharacterized protein n=1 Tax=Cryphonectria parasitica (strain ATCC 38755 / EP155) TaxID=660469 RepID=A0A9P4XT35_CRYP1|nr:uncharacterized protein M406DRAFT_295808 [Cryphonectria parasitica EP155]KAF3760469.1 hypothetical protein M406DRAFT_295808 [Cryphonectria parasitica EP155]